MLELRPSCEHCSKQLPPDSTEAMICSFECTFCASCVTEVLENVCPNCGGSFCQRPVRPATDRKNGNFLGKYPAVKKVTYKPVNRAAHAEFASNLKAIPAEKR